MDQRIVSREIENRSFTPAGAFEPSHPDREVFRYKLTCGHVVEKDSAIHDANRADVKLVDCSQCEVEAAMKAAADAATSDAPAKSDDAGKGKGKRSTSE